MSDKEVTREHLRAGLDYIVNQYNYKQKHKLDIDPFLPLGEYIADYLFDNLDMKFKEKQESEK